MRFEDSFGCWTRVAVLAVCCSLPSQLAARDSFAGKMAGQERSDNELKMKFCWCPSGEFRMGREYKMGKGQVGVTLTRGFWLGECEVTEAQWEYACRAGTTTMFSFGDDESQVGDYAWYSDNSFSRQTDAVGQRKANAWGLCDMHGNVWEWCRDAWQSRLPGGENPEVSGKSSKRVARGGGYYNTATGCRSAMRTSFALDQRGYGELGFRVAVVRVNASGTKASK